MKLKKQDTPEKRSRMKPDIQTFIIYEDTHIIVCRKPAGIAVQTARIGARDIVSLLKNHLFDMQGHYSPGARPHDRQDGQKTSRHSREPYLAVIHRLDQPVEGLLVFAKTPKAAKELNRQLTSHSFGKYYRALVTGIPDPSEGTLEDYLVKDARTNTSRVCAKDTPGSKLARLHYRVDEIYKNTEPVTSLVKIRLDTGRHHQIRVQMAHLGCPLVGDQKYGGVSAYFGETCAKRTESPAHIKNSGPLRLCAYRLEFIHPETGKRLAFTLP